MSCYPVLSEGAAINSLKLLFPNGCKISPQKKNPIHQSCYITVDDSSLDQCMLTFIKYSEKTSDQFTENVVTSYTVLQLQFQGFHRTIRGESHRIHIPTPRQQVNGKTAELHLCLLAGILDVGAYRSSRPFTERIISHMVDHLVVSNDSTTVYRPLPLDNGAVMVPEVRIFSTPKLPNLPVGLA